MQTSITPSQETPFKFDIFKIAILFLTTRWMFLFWFTPLHREFEYHFSLASFSSQGKYPFLHYWMEYPPIYPWLSVAFYNLSEWEFLPNSSHFQRYSFIVSFFNVLWDTGVLLLIYGLGRTLYSQNKAEQIAIFYSLLFFPLFVIFSFFDSLPLFFILLSLYLIVKKQEMWASVTIALGIAIKLIPILLVPLLLRSKRKRILSSLLLVVTLLIIFVPFLCYNATWIKTFARVTQQRPGWETVWALLDGQYSYGYVGPVKKTPLDPVPTQENYIQSRFSSKIDKFPQGSPFFSQWYLFIGIIFFLVWANVYRKLPEEISPGLAITFSAFSMIIFFLYAKGWSPQFIIYVLPFVLLVTPTRFFLPLLLSIINFVEMPLWVFFLADYSVVLGVVIISRTTLLGYLGYLFYLSFKEQLDLS